MLALLNKLRNAQGGVCLSIILNTHRTKPQNLKDVIHLKNLLAEAEKRLSREFDKDIYLPMIRQLDILLEDLDHNYNLESMALFVNQDLAELVRLPVPVTDRVVIGDRFATRDIIRALNTQSTYYVLVFSRRHARLIEAFNDKVVREIANDDFPMTNPVIETDPLILTMAQGQNNIMEKFFIEVDKALTTVTNERPLPVVLSTEKSNADHYMKVARKKERFIGHINMNRDEDPAHRIVTDAWDKVQEFLKEQNKGRIDDLKKAVSSGQFFSDYNDIWRAIEEGRGRTLFVKKGLIKPAIVKNGQIRLVDEPIPTEDEMVEDIIDVMIARMMEKGGETIFIEGDELAEFQDLAMTARY